MSLFNRGIFSVLIVYVPDVNSSQILPPFKKKAVCDGYTTSYEPIRKSSDGNL